MKTTYRNHTYISILGVLLVFSALIVLISLNRERKLKSEIFITDQILYANIVEEFIGRRGLYPDSLSTLSGIISLFPDHLKVDVLNEEGDILYNNHFGPDHPAGNDAESPEIKMAFLYGKGQSIRKSEIFDNTFMYYAVHCDDHIVRIAFPYGKVIKNALKPDITFIVLEIALFLLFAFILSLFYLDFRKSISRLKAFLSEYQTRQKFPTGVQFRDNDLQEIQEMIVDISKQLEVNKKTILLEREKLLEHFHHSEEGISFFTKKLRNIYTNSHFIQYLNTILNQVTFDVNDLFKSPVFGEIVQFLENPDDKRSVETTIHVSRNSFFVQAIIFDDSSFEIIIRDISEVEKNNFDRAEMINNIAHELRTPVTSVRGYLETMIEYDDLSKEKRNDFIQRAYKQTLRLSEIIHDVVLLSKTNDASKSFDVEDINIHDLIRELLQDTREIIQKYTVTIDCQVGENVVVRGSRTLLTSIFWNLFNNALKYAGDNVTVSVRNYMEDKEFYYFSFADNGKGIEDKYLNHIFERFYRINEGRTRGKGGSGLGLAIVKDAIKFHHGEIHAKNRADGGLEFLFTLRKK
ncbi:MAG: HAMP domain-containing histidine kinase [Dysgonamonadaceae bacterium]|jgi:signal transduction histidine kinase|nr:HAMP domain-containing histidine kinase [Dysgonamonadaceae bacterium]